MQSDTEIIKQTLVIQGRRQNWLAKILGVDKSLVSHWLSGRRKMPEEMVAKAALILGIHIPKGK